MKIDNKLLHEAFEKACKEIDINTKDDNMEITFKDKEYIAIPVDINEKMQELIKTTIRNYLIQSKGR